MGTVIKTTSMCIGNGTDDSSIELAARAANECIKISGVKENIDFLINIGVYRDKNIVEPAMASLIQKRICLNLNPDASQIEMGKGTFSFDIINGSCGFLSAAQVTDAFFKNNKAKYVLITASDVHPSGEKKQDFPFTHSGSAILLEQSNNRKRGFKDFLFKTSDSGTLGLRAYCDISAYGNQSRSSGTVEVEVDYGRRLQKFTINTIKELSDSKLIDLPKVKCVITSQPFLKFTSNFADILGFEENSVLNVYDQYGDTNSSALIIGYHIAIEKGLIKEKDQVLFIGGGSGLTFACGLYFV